MNTQQDRFKLLIRNLRTGKHKGLYRMKQDKHVSEMNDAELNEAVDKSREQQAVHRARAIEENLRARQQMRYSFSVQEEQRRRAEGRLPG